VRLITNVEIEGFRSVVHGSLDNLSSFTCLVGPNNSGKSNVLRALNLFMTDEPIPGYELDMGRDFHVDPRKKKRKQIAITVDFELPRNFGFRKGMERVKRELGRRFTIRRVWRAYPGDYWIEIRKRTPNFRTLNEGLFWQFVKLIGFRYIENRTIPSEVLEAESDNFRKLIINRLRRKGVSETDELMNAFGNAAADTIKEANTLVAGDVPSIRRLVLGPPEISTLFGMGGFGAETQAGAIIDDDALGAGSQAYMMFHLLKLIDTAYSTRFGWRQGAVWAVEEPESSLHDDLASRLARMFSLWSSDDNLKMQIIASTHSEVIASTADSGYLIELEDGIRTTIKEKTISELIHASVRAGVSGQIDPIVCYPTNTVVLVEGPLDRWVLEGVAKKTQTACGCRFLCLSELDAQQSGGGVNSIIDYLKRWGRLTSNRAADSPLMVLFDYSVTDIDFNKACEYYGQQFHNRVLRMDVRHADRNVSNILRGIERFYPRELYIRAREGNIARVNEDQYGVVSIDRNSLSAGVKHELARMFLDGPAGWCDPIKQVLGDVLSHSLQ
jgi:hypothetical protein